MGWIKPTEDEFRRPTVKFLPVRCPNCGSKKQRSYGTKGRLRYHQCRKCELKFKSIENEFPN